MNQMPSSVGKLFKDSMKAGYTVQHGRQQVMLSYHGRKVGSWNTLDRHWYVSRVIASGHDELLRRHGFCWKGKPGHEWWQLVNADNLGSFQAVVETLTCVSMEPP